MSSVPSNLTPVRITNLPEAPVADPAGYFPIVISGTTYKVQFSQIQGNVEVPASRLINAGTGLTGGGSLSQDITIAVANGGIGDSQLNTTGVGAGTYGTGALVPVITVNAQGRVTSLSTTALSISGYVPDNRQIVAGVGLSGGGNLSADRTLDIAYSTTIPSALGPASAGVSDNPARADHVHPALDLSDGSETTGLLPMGRGGTGANLSPAAGAIAYSTGSQFALGPTGGVGQVLVSGGTGAYTWGSVQLLAPVAANIVFAGPASGPDADPTFRALVSDDFPTTLNGKTLESAIITNALSLTAVSADITTLTSASATLTNLTSTSGTVDTLAGSNWTVTNLTATSATISNFTFTSSTVSDLTATRLTATSAHITTLSSNSATLTNLTSTSGTISTLKSTSADITNLAVSSLTVSSLSLSNATFTSATITTLNSTSANITTLTGTTFGTTATTQLRGASGQISQLNSTSATITTLASTSAAITNLSVSSLTVSSLSLSNATFTSATITTLNSTSATIANLNSTSANITTLTGTTFGTTAATQLRGASGQITNLTSTSATITTINSTSGTIANFAATTATISSVVLVGTTVNTNGSSIAATGTISEGVGGVQYLVASQYDVGTSPNQIPLNQYLGSMAFQSSAAISVTDITMAGSLTGTIAGGTY